jgi:hypothetical protein
MCTLSWLRTGAGYILFMSRDEQRLRGVAEPPSVRRRGERLILSPRDPDGGGTWISVNDAGLAVALLNRRYERRRPGMMSRGLAVERLAASASQVEALAAIEQLPLSLLAPFALGIFQPGHAVAIIEWDGSALEQGRREADGLVLTSSSLDAGAARDARHRALNALQGQARIDAAVLDALHRDHGSDRRFSACMHREDARTMSLSRIDVGPDSASLTYEPGSPCERPEATVVTVARQPSHRWQAAC